MAVAKQRGINLVRQPPNSPELNACDLGVWRSLQSRVKAKNLSDVSWKNISHAQKKLWDAILEAWEEIEPKVIFNTFAVRDEIAKELTKYQGAAIITKPHEGARKKCGTG